MTLDEQEREDPTTIRKGSLASENVINVPIPLNRDEGKHNRLEGEP